MVFDLAVTVCDRVRQACPIWSTEIELPSKSPRAREVIHRTFDDAVLAAGSDEVQLEVFRRVRDEIKDWISYTFIKYKIKMSLESNRECIFKTPKASYMRILACI